MTPKLESPMLAFLSSSQDRHSAPSWLQFSASSGDCIKDPLGPDSSGGFTLPARSQSRRAKVAGSILDRRLVGKARKPVEKCGNGAVIEAKKLKGPFMLKIKDTFTSLPWQRHRKHKCVPHGHPSRIHVQYMFLRMSSAPPPSCPVYSASCPIYRPSCPWPVVRESRLSVTLFRAMVGSVSIGHSPIGYIHSPLYESCWSSDVGAFKGPSPSS